MTAAAAEQPRRVQLELAVDERPQPGPDDGVVVDQHDAGLTSLAHEGGSDAVGAGAEGDQVEGLHVVFVLLMHLLGQGPALLLLAEPEQVARELRFGRQEAAVEGQGAPLRRRALFAASESRPR